MKYLDMNELTQALIAKGYDARYEMSGGGNGTICLYHLEEDKFGDVFMAIGPSDYSTGLANSDELNWGILQGDEEEDEPSDDYYYFNDDEESPFTVENVADAIDFTFKI
jgi:hypothetical protein